MSHRKYHAQSGGVNGIETIVHENFEKKKRIIQPYILYIMITFKPVKRRGGKEGGGSCLSLSENNLTQLSFCNFFFHAKIMRPIC